LSSIRARTPNRESTRRLAQLQSVTDAALAHLDLDELLAELLERIRTSLDVDTAAILLLDADRDELVARAAVGIEEEVERGVRIPVGVGFAGRVAAERRAVILPDVDHAHILNPILLDKGIKSMLGVPLHVAGAVIGVLHVGTLVPREFTADDVELLQLVADRSAVAIDRARLYESERMHRRRIERVQAVTDVALAHLAFDDLMDALLRRTREILEADTCAVLLLDRDTNELVARAAVGLEEEVEAGVRVPMGAGFAGRVASGRRAIVLRDVDTANVWNPILREKGIKSMLGVPLILHDDVTGVLHVGTLVHREFSPDDIELLQLVGERVAIAIERTKLHEDMVRLDQMKLNFVAIASHELRTPATSVYGILTTLRARGDALMPEVREELEETAWHQSDRLRRLIEQLLDLSRLDAKAIEVQPEPLVLERTLKDVVNGGDDVVVDVDPALAVVADPLVIERVVSNLVRNARQHGRPPVRVSAEQRDRHLRITVTDRGEGVPEDLVPRLFERFEHGAGGGTGLGLAIARAYAQAHGGDLYYEAGETGARFDLLLPRL
jgi:signal transduction histidine kinase